MYQSKSGNLDQIGCVKPQNNVAQEFNRQLKDMVFQLRAQLPNAAFTYVDVFSAKYDLISNAKNEGSLNLLYKHKGALCIVYDLLFGLFRYGNIKMGGCGIVMHYTLHI